MKYDTSMKLYGRVLSHIVRRGVPDREMRKKILKEYQAVMERADDIGSKNNLLSSYMLAAYFIAMNRSTGLSAEQNAQILGDGMHASWLLKYMLGDSGNYFSEEHRKNLRAWSLETHYKRYKNDWVVDILEKDDDFDLGFDYLECGVCKLCRDEGCPELAKYMCRLDYMLFELMGIELVRTMTLAEGGEKCDFRMRKK